MDLFETEDAADEEEFEENITNDDDYAGCKRKSGDYIYLTKYYIL